MKWCIERSGGGAQHDVRRRRAGARGQRRDLTNGRCLDRTRLKAAGRMTLGDGREELREQRVVGVAQQREQVAVQLVVVALAPARRLVHHLARKVRDGLTEEAPNVRSAYSPGRWLPGSNGGRLRSAARRSRKAA